MQFSHVWLLSELCFLSSAWAPHAAWGAAPVFYDEFDGAAVNTNAWIEVGPDRRNYLNEIQCYVPGAVAAADGRLVITSRQADISCNAGSGYTSGMIQWRSYHFT